MTSTESKSAMSHADDTITNVHVNRLPGDPAAEIAEERGGHPADFLVAHRTAQGRALLNLMRHRMEIANRRRRQRPRGTGADRIDANILRPEIGGEVAHA